ncbi:hypothetical protein NEF87_002522 [Candidatus Lokiarchaeum ossiferum]|uniref:TsaA-like domain-containing protein n=1 Tax=Candidatus Lokiarchaeum ossiferum TaxID=2951803 RepID=A0ABY6HV55_9ARCH|nr:hypothetical protein NEF87_002522 [Candidatus Lokiarchaeum sp. B-35]
MTAKKEEIVLHPIGEVKSKEGKTWIEVKEQYRLALKELEKFTHVNIVWWAHKNDTPKRRAVLLSEELPPFYGKDAPSMGVFANRSEFRPNPICVSATQIIKVDLKEGIIQIPWTDAFPGTPIVDIKPYLPMADIIEGADYPNYLQHWPKSQEAAMKWWAEMEQE